MSFTSTGRPHITRQEGRDLTRPKRRRDALRIRVGGVTVPIEQPIEPPDVARLCDRVCALIGPSTPEPIVCEVSSLVPADAATVDLVARLALAGRRLGRSVVVRDAPIALLDLLSFCGLGEAAALLLEPERQAEQGEDAIDGQEERDPVDPAV